MAMAHVPTWGNVGKQGRSDASDAGQSDVANKRREGRPGPRRALMRATGGWLGSKCAICRWSVDGTGLPTNTKHVDLDTRLMKLVSSCHTTRGT